MAWEKVDAGTATSGSYVIERRVFRVSVPGTMGRFPIQLRSYRWKVTGSDGTVSRHGTASSREAARALVRSKGDEHSSE